MNYRKLQSLLPPALACALVWTAPAGARDAEAGPEDVIEVRARLRFATAVVLPPDERILDWICGDADYWSVQGTANLAFVKPTAKGIRTNVTLVTDLGNVYTLLFRELGDEPGEPDLKLFLRPRGSDDPERRGLEPVRFEARDAAARLEREADAARQRALAAEERADREIASGIERFRSEYPGSLRFDYSLERTARAAPFKVRAMWRDERFTYIRADPEEVPVLYEQRDGKPSLVPYDFADGLYVTRRILADGWLQIGKRKLRFRRHGIWAARDLKEALP